MATKQHNVSRRQALVGIGTALAAAPVAATGIATGKPDHSAWDAAVAKLATVDARYENMSALMTKMHDAAEAACPRQDECFQRHSLRHGASYDSNFRAAHMSLIIERAKGRDILPADECKKITADAHCLVDDFEAYHARREEAFRNYHPMEDEFDAVVDKRWQALNDLLTTPAPDEQAVLFKLERLTVEMTSAAVEDAERVEAVRNDARRLFGRA